MSLETPLPGPLIEFYLLINVPGEFIATTSIHYATRSPPLLLSLTFCFVGKRRGVRTPGLLAHDVIKDLA